MKNVYQQVLLHFPQATFQSNTSQAVQQGSDLLGKDALPKYQAARSEVPTPLIFPFKLELLCDTRTQQCDGRVTRAIYQGAATAVPMRLSSSCPLPRAPHPPRNRSHIESSTMTRQH